jgi:hypothetical protein
MRLREDESGVSLIIVVLFLTVIIVFASLAIDTANWFVHKRHLQTQADAGAFAAARDFQFPCGSTASSPPNTQIIATAHQYDGTAAGSYNAQVGTPAATPAASYSASSHNIFSLVNSANFINQSTPNDTDVTGDPCRDEAIDLKLSETNTPWFFRLAGVDYINAQARVSIRNLASTGGQLPLGVPSPTPNKMAATFIDEATGQALAGPVNLTSSSDGTTWTSNATPVTFGSTVSGRVGLRVAISGSSATDCAGDSVVCYDTGATQGVVFLHTWSGDGTPGVVLPPATAPAPPQVRDVTLLPAGDATNTACADGYFTASSSSCTVRLQADLVFATGVQCKDVTLTVAAAPSSGTVPTMPCPNANSAPATGTWQSSLIPVTANSGPYEFSVSWSQSAGTKPAGASGGTNATPSQCTNSKPCTGSFGIVQRIFSGSPDLSNAGASRSGPISFASVTEPVAETNTVRRCSVTANFVFSTCTHSLVATVKVYGLQNAGTIGSPPTRLRLSDSQANYALDCGQGNGSAAYTTAIATGCTGPYATTTADRSICATPSTPAVCVGENPGTGKKIEPGLDTRINGGSTCTHRNYWVAPNTIPQILATPDPRLVKVFLVPFGSLNSGSGDVPIRAFAYFYITGWNGSPCTTAGPSANPPYAADTPAAQGEVWGHFVKYVEPDTGGTPGGACDPNSINGCIAVLSK